MYQLAGFRAIQGIGAGGLFSLALAIIGDIVPPRERAKYQGYFLAVFGTSSVLGPGRRRLPRRAGPPCSASPAGAGSSWSTCRSASCRCSLVIRILHLPHTRRDHRIDYPGALALIVGLVPLLIVAEQGREWGWTSGRALGCYVIGVVGIVAFLLAERAYGDDALLPLRLFRAGRSASARSSTSSSAWACSAASPPCRSTCRSSRASPRPRPACCCCR